MRYTLLMFALMILSEGAFALGDSLIVKFKSGDIEKIAISNIKAIKFENITSIDLLNNLLNKSKNYPNPFTEKTTIEFELEIPQYVNVFVYDNSGTLVRNFKCENCKAGKNQINWNAENNYGKTVPAGVYYLEITSKNKTLFKQIIKIK